MSHIPPLPLLSRALEDIEGLPTDDGFAARLEALTQVAGMLMHDFNNVLSGASAATDLLLDELPPHTPALRHAEELRHALTLAADMVGQLGSLLRHRRPRFEPIDLDALVRDVEPLLRNAIGPTIRLCCLLASEGAFVLGEKVQLTRMLLNLAINARDAVEKGSGIVQVLSWRETAGTVHLAVRDNGCGMSEESLARIFEPYYTTKPDGYGTGLGLAQVQNTIDQHRGTIRVASAPGRGTAFTIVLPTTDTTGDGRAAARGAQASSVPTHAHDPGEAELPW